MGGFCFKATGFPHSFFFRKKKPGSHLRGKKGEWKNKPSRWVICWGSLLKSFLESKALLEIESKCFLVASLKKKTHFNLFKCRQTDHVYLAFVLMIVKDCIRYEIDLSKSEILYVCIWDSRHLRREIDTAGLFVEGCLGRKRESWVFAVALIRSVIRLIFWYRQTNRQGNRQTIADKQLCLITGPWSGNALEVKNYLPSQFKIIF